MKVAAWINTGAQSLFLGTFLLGTTVLMQAQDRPDNAKPAEPDNRPEATKPSPQDESSPNPKESKPSKQDEDKSAPHNQDKSTPQNEDKTAHGNEDKASRGDNKAGKQEEQSERGRQPGEAAEGVADRRGGHIPDEKFHANFGREHRFKMQRPTVVEGRPTFQYSGYSFVLVDAWPMEWAYTDDCYIDYIDGEYFLFDLAHPGVRLAIVVTM
jgi:hypothetical protein